MKLKSSYILLSFGILLVICGVLVMMVIKQQGECLINPFVYGASEFKKQNAPITCTCNILDKNGGSFTFDEYEIKPVENNNPRIPGNSFNLSTLNITK